MILSDENTLPEGFDHLSKFVKQWCVETTQERWEVRCQSSMEELRSFYNAVLASAEDALKHLDSYDLDNLPDPERNLFLLMLALTNVSMAVELHKQPRAPHSPWPHGIRVLKGAVPFGGSFDAN